MFVGELKPKVKSTRLALPGGPMAFEAVLPASLAPLLA